ncbi:glycosyltransferase family 1 protein [Jannaschia rubra]|uniref:glycosyltransferase family 1 protein n=1 Tax=Jannaschia rubra TaxID=282197 RepID=UPI0024909AD5|nr:glycosyltransferase family 1 protein [Jannaschia rubra]
MFFLSSKTLATPPHVPRRRGWTLWDRIGKRRVSSLDRINHVEDTVRRGAFDVDVCIVTNCMSNGGNAVSTISEFKAFRAAGLSVMIVHCSIRSSPWKAYWLFEGYSPYSAFIANSRDVRRMRCRNMIVRAPRAIMSVDFIKFAQRVEANHAIFVVNNSTWNENGREGYSWVELYRRIQNLSWPSVELCPIGPQIREEANQALANTGIENRLTAREWPPTFDVDLYPFDPERRLTYPIRIGRHARDHPAKWLESREELLKAYPIDDPQITVSILGGADEAGKVLGAIPSEWSVLPFGLGSVSDYLAQLDVFVYFPSVNRHEAFGRTIVEAILSGIPVVLPPRFRTTFGELAFYCWPDEVAAVVHRLAIDPEKCNRYVNEVRNIAIERFCNPALLRRLDKQSLKPASMMSTESLDWRRTVASDEHDA